MAAWLTITSTSSFGLEKPRPAEWLLIRLEQGRRGVIIVSRFSVYSYYSSEQAADILIRRTTRNIMLLQSSHLFSEIHAFFRKRKYQ